MEALESVVCGFVLALDCAVKVWLLHKKIMQDAKMSFFMLFFLKAKSKIIFWK
jgi:hypothetical protein